MKKFFPILFCICLCTTLLTGCNGPKKNAADSVQAIYELYILGNTDGIAALGIPEEDIDNARQTYHESLKETIRVKFAASGQEISEDVLNELFEARKTALSKMSASAEVISESSGKATVVVHTTYFDEDDLDADAYYEARETAWQHSFPTVADQKIFLMDTYTQNLIAAYENVTPSEKTTDIAVECVIQNNTWVPANMSSFGSDLALAITGRKLETIK
ncbi:hypothetical protein C806_00632 [Lachnospiraceae bacterium 3-1]|nr:hypothetical protein C806_00632 [Lachnospiraceae bacterium 3-1]